MNGQQNMQVVPDEVVISKIYQIRGQKVMLDRDLAELYGVETKRLKEQVKRNQDRFPPPYMFELTEREFATLRSQNATSKEGGAEAATYLWCLQNMACCNCPMF